MIEKIINSPRDNFWLFYSVMSTGAVVFMALFSFGMSRLFNPSGTKERIEEAKEFAKTGLPAMIGFPYVAYLISLTGLEFPGVITFYLFVIGAMIADHVIELKKKEKNSTK